MSDFHELSAEHDLAAVLRAERIDDHHFLLRVPGSWRQGRGAFGGLVLGALVSAAEAVEDDSERVTRSVTGVIPGPVLAGEAHIEVRTLRRGTGMSTLRATLTQSGELLAEASVVTGRRRRDAPEWGRPSPTIGADWREVGVVRVAPPEAPEYTQHFEYRCTGPLPFSGALAPLTAGWVRPRVPLTALGAPEVVAMADSWWPAWFSFATAARPVGTVAFSLQYFPPPPGHDPEQPLYFRGHAEHARDGFYAEFRELWTADGRLVALNQQTVVIIR